MTLSGYCLSGERAIHRVESDMSSFNVQAVMGIALLVGMLQHFCIISTLQKKLSVCLLKGVILT